MRDTARDKKRQRVAAGTDVIPAPLDMYRARVTACSSRDAERAVSLHEANPGHVTLLLSVQQQQQQEKEMDEEVRGRERATSYLSFVENYAAIKEILVSAHTSEHAPAADVAADNDM